MTKPEFLGHVKILATEWSGTMPDWRPSYITEIREHDPQLAALVQARSDAQDAIQAYCAARLEGR